jgi:hypothetical protein
MLVRIFVKGHVDIHKEMKFLVVGWDLRNRCSSLLHSLNRMAASLTMNTDDLIAFYGTD